MEMPPDVQFVTGIALGIAIVGIIKLISVDGDLWWLDFKDWLRRKRWIK